MMVMMLVMMSGSFPILFFHFFTVGFTGFFHCLAVRFAVSVVPVMPALVIVAVSVIISVGCIDGVEVWRADADSRAERVGADRNARARIGRECECLGHAERWSDHHGAQNPENYFFHGVFL